MITEQQQQTGRYRSSNFSYAVKKQLAVLSKAGDTSKEVNLVSYNDAPAKLDIRSWKRWDGGEQVLKGITLNAEEVDALKEALAKFDPQSIAPKEAPHVTTGRTYADMLQEGSE